MEAANNPFKIAKARVMELAIHATKCEIDIGFVAMALLSKSLRKMKVSQLQAFVLRKECIVMLADIVNKKQQRCPLKYNFARMLGNLDPRWIVA